MNETERFQKVKEEISIISDKKIRFEERFNNEKTNLEKILKEITEKGYDPKKLSEIREKKEEQLQTLLTELENNVEETKQKLNKIEPNNE